MSIASKFAGAALAVITLGSGSVATAAANATNPPCFFITQWQGWRAPDSKTIYLRVNMKDIYRADLSAGSDQLTWPGVYHLVSRVQGSSSICGPLDLQLAVSDSHGYYQPLIVRSLVKLTPEEAAALPAKDRP